MKRLFAFTVSLTLLGAGCGQPSSPVPPGATPATTPSAATSTSATSTTKAPALAPKTPTKTTKPAATNQPSPSPTANVSFVSGQLQLGTPMVNATWITLAWSRSTTNDIQGYAIVKSTSDTNPYYPKEFWTHFENNIQVLTWNDTAAKVGVRTYYRICAIANDNSIRCGNVVSAVKP